MKSQSKSGLVSECIAADQVRVRIDLINSTVTYSIV